MPHPSDRLAASVSAELRDRGVALVRGELPGAELAALSAETGELIRRFTEDGYRSADFWCYDVADTDLPMLYRVHNLEKQQGVPHIASLFGGGALHELAESILGPARATVCAMVVKTPGVAGVPWHRDRTEHEPGTAVNLSVFLDDATAANGCFEAVPASHRRSADEPVEDIRAAGPVVRFPAQRGDVLVHDVRLVHGSGDNTSAALRRSIVMEFVAVPGER